MFAENRIENALTCNEIFCDTHLRSAPAQRSSRRRSDFPMRCHSIGFAKMTVEEKNALDVLADAVNRCRKEDMRTPEVFASLDLLAQRASVRWPFEQFKDSLNFAVGDSSHAEGRWQNVHASLNAIRRVVGAVWPCP
jgi:hypothetical protein